jgi:hypothetical protein
MPRPGYDRVVRPIRGPRHAADDDATVEALPDEPTLSAVGLDVRAAFEAQDRTVPGAVVGLAPMDVPIEEEEPRQGRTMPLVSPTIVRNMQAQAQVPAEFQPQSPSRRAAAPAHVPLPPPSDPILVTRRDDDEAANGDDSPIEIPGVGGAQRKRMLRIVIGVLSLCGLLCVGAVVRQLLGAGGSSSTATSSSTAATPNVTPAATASAPPAATETAAPSATAPAPATAAPSAAPMAEPSAAPMAAPSVPPPPPSPPPVVATPSPVAAPAAPPPRAAALDAPPPARRAAPAAAPRPRGGGSSPAKPRPTIVRDAPF